MQQELISKKELLEATEISYGQLYRWKRKKLIPEDWFIKKSSFTGQETFFPRNKILERIGKIKNMKDDASLDDLAAIFSPELSDKKIKTEQLIANKIIVREVLDIFIDRHQQILECSFNEILAMNITQKLLIEGYVSKEEAKNILKILEENYLNFDGKDCELIFIRKMGVGLCFLIVIPNQIYFDEDSKVIIKLSIAKCIENLKTKLKELF